jgi:hypothetical protein
MRVRRWFRVVVALTAVGLLFDTGGLVAHAASAAASGTGSRIASAAAASQTEAASALAAARSSGQRVEIVGRREEARQVFAEANGSFSMELDPQPVRVRRGTGWAAVDTTLRAQPDGTVATVATVSSLTLSGGGPTAPLVRLADGDRRIDLSWPGPLPAPKLSGGTATYADVIPGVDLQVRGRAKGFSEVLLVKTRAAGADPRLARVTFGVATAGLTLGSDGSGGLSARDVTGAEVYVSPRAQMWDTPAGIANPPAGQPVESAPVGAHQSTGTLEVAAGKLTVVPDRALLADPATNYPVSIDPDFAPPVVGWAKVFAGYPDNAYWNGGGDDGLAKVGYCGWDGCNGVAAARSYFQFDISALRGAQILGAELNVHEVWAPSCSPRVFEVWQTGPIGPWTTWNNQPGGWWGPIGSPNVAYGYNGCGPNWVGVDAGQSVVNQLDGGSNVATFVLKGTGWWATGGESDAYAWKKFDSGSLVVQYNWPPDVPSGQWTNAGQGPSLGCPRGTDTTYASSATPTMHATLTDRDGQNLQADFEWWVRGGGRVGETVTPFQPNGTELAATIPAGAFDDGASISWHVRGGDGLTWGPWSDWCQVNVDRTAPHRPAVTSADYPEGGVAGYVGKTGAFAVTANDPDVIGFQWSVDFQDMPPVDVSSPFFAPMNGGAATIRATPPRDGRNDLYVRAVDRALNVSPVYQRPDGSGGWLAGGYAFTVGSSRPGPIGYWPLDGLGAATAALDASGHGHDGTVNGIWPGTGASWTAGRVGDAVNIGGTTGTVTTAGGQAVNTASTYTVAAWVNLAAADGTWRAAVSQDGTLSSGFVLEYRADTQRWTFGISPADASSPAWIRAGSAAPAQAGVWTHLLGSFDSGSRQLLLYVNGQLSGTAQVPSGTTVGNVTGGGIVVGRARQAGACCSWLGAIDEVRVWDRLLAGSEIQDLANRPAAEEVFYPLDEGGGTTTADVSGAYDTGTLSGGASWVPGTVGAGAVRLDGTGAVTSARLAVRTDGSFTVTARARLDAAGGSTQTVVSQDGPRSSGFALQYLSTTGRWAFAISPQDAANPAWITANGGTAAAAGRWVSLAGVYDAARGEARLYVDGVETTAPGRVAANVSGNLVLGRARRNGGPVAWFAGRVDDVHVYTGVRGKDEIVNDNLDPVTGRPTAYFGQLSRYVSTGGRHFVTSGPVPRDQHFEWSLGQLAPAGAAGTVMLRSCMYAGGHQFISIQPDCEGSPKLGDVGLLYSQPPAGVPTVPIYRCVVLATQDFFATTDPSCEGQHVDGLAGYARGYRQLVRSVTAYGPHDHWTTVTGVTAAYRPEGVQGLVALTGEPNALPLMSCAEGSDEFLSNDPSCGGRTVLGWMGNTWSVPPAYAQASQPLYSCQVAATGERFSSLDEFCEGETVLGNFGYVITGL